MIPTHIQHFTYYAMALAITAGMSTFSVQAEDRTWDGSYFSCNSGFAENACWSSFDSPDSNDNALFTNSEPSSDRWVNFNNGNFTNLNATVLAGGYVWDLGTGSGSGLYRITNNLFVGSSGGLTVRDGTVNAQNTQVFGSLSVSPSANLNTDNLFAPGPISSITTGATNTAVGGQINIDGALTLTGGATATSYKGYVDSVSTNFGNTIEARSATVSGEGSRWDTRSFDIGSYGTGEATVSDGAVVASTGSTFVGFSINSDGTLNINSGGTVETSGAGYVSYSAGSAGRVTVGGTGALWNVANALNVGSNPGGEGTLTVNSGGTVNAASLTVQNGVSDISTGTTGTTSGGQINIDGALKILGGATATSRYGFVDSVSTYLRNSIEAGSAFVRGEGSRWDTRSFEIGYEGTGEATVWGGAVVTSSANSLIGVLSGSDGNLNISSGGSVFTNGAGYVAYYAGSTGTVTVGGADALWKVRNGLHIGGSDTTSGGTGTLTVNDGGTVNAGSLSVYNGDSAITTGETNTATGGQINIDGALTLTGGATATSRYGFVDSVSSFHANSIEAGSATVSGEGSRWDTRSFEIGIYGTGEATVSDGAVVTSSANSLIGFSSGSDGTLNITSGGTVDTNGSGYVSYYTGSAGRVTVGGNDALWDVDKALYVGASGGAGSLMVNEGGTVNAGSLSVYNGDSAITTGETNTATGGQINIDGALTLTGGATATSFYGFVDSVSTNFDNTIEAASATVSGEGSRWDTRSFEIGYLGTGGATVSDGAVVTSSASSAIGFSSGSDGSLNINSGGTVDTDGNGYLAYGAGSAGTVNVDGNDALWDVANGLYVGGSETTSGGAGTLTVNSGGTVNAGSLTVYNGDSSINTGATNVFTGGQINIYGALTLIGGATATSGGGLVDRASTGFSNTIQAGSASVSGEGSRWDVGYFKIGSSATGEITVADGAVLASTNGTYVGYESGSDGSLNINSGGTVDTDGNGHVAYDAGSAGTVTVGGADAVWDVANGLYVGGSETTSGGAGTLTVNSGGTVNAGSLTVYNGDSSITTGATNTFKGGQINIDGALTLTGGATATSGGGLVDIVSSDFSNSIEAGSASVNGEGSRWDTGTFISGRAGTGEVTVANGAVVASIDNTYVGLFSGSNGTLNINSGGTLDTGGTGIVASYIGSAGTVTVDGNDALWDVANGLYVGGSETTSGGTGTLTVNNGGTVNAGSLTVYNGDSSITTGATNTFKGGQINIDGTLTLTGGATATSRNGFVDSVSSIYANTIEAGSATVSGEGSLWDTSYLYIGRAGTGEATVWGGAVINSSANSLIGVLSGSDGNLNISSGGTVFTNGAGYVAYYAGSTGTVTVGGADALWEVRNGLHIGGSDTTSGGTGTLTVNSGGTVKAGSLSVYNGDSSITTGATNTFEGGQINIDGALTLTGGATATSRYGFVDIVSSDFSNSIEAGSASVNGEGSRWDTGTFISGRAGTGEVTVANGAVVASIDNTYVGITSGSDGSLNVNAGGTVETNGAGYVAYDAGSAGTVTVDGNDALWDVANGLYVGGNETTSGGVGTLNVNSAGTVNVGSLKVWQSGTVNVAGGLLNIQGDMVNNGLITISDNELLTLTGNISGSGSFVGATLLNGASINPGNSPGTLTFGDTTWDNVDLSMEVAAAVGGGFDYDSIDILGNLTLLSAFTINFDFLDGLEFADLIGESFNFLSISGRVLDGAGVDIDLASWAITLVDGWAAQWLSDSDGWHLALNSHNTSVQNNPSTDVPEPGSLLLILLAGAGVMYQRKKLAFAKSIQS
jgi:T5SS/PEP-CTERM-associated repeat protein